MKTTKPETTTRKIVLALLANGKEVTYSVPENVDVFKAISELAYKEYNIPVLGYTESLFNG